MFHQLPESIQSEIFEWDSTYHSLFRLCLEEIECRIATQVSQLYLRFYTRNEQNPSIITSLGYFQFKYKVPGDSKSSGFSKYTSYHIVFISEGTTCFNDTQYILQDWNMTKGTRRTRYIYL